MSMSVESQVLVAGDHLSTLPIADLKLLNI